MENTTLTEAELREEIIKAIKRVYDPEIPVDVYELGLIYDLKIFPVNNVYVSMKIENALYLYFLLSNCVQHI